MEGARWWSVKNNRRKRKEGKGILTVVSPCEGTADSNIIAEKEESGGRKAEERVSRGTRSVRELRSFTHRKLSII